MTLNFSPPIRRSFRQCGQPKKPQDLIDHNCIRLRLPTHGGLYAWEFEKAGRELRVRVDGQLTYNTTAQMLNAALAGLGLAYVPEGLAQPHLAKGRLKRVLADWCLPYSGYHLYYPSRRQPSAAFALLVDALRYRQRVGKPDWHGRGSVTTPRLPDAPRRLASSVGRCRPSVAPRAQSASGPQHSGQPR
jgi:DNA-binding transcriptional LysR family regulator